MQPYCCVTADWCPGSSWKFFLCGYKALLFLVGQIDFGLLMCYNLVTLRVLEFSKYD